MAKIASEGVVHAAARMLELPSTIARMNIGYGMASHGGVPVMYCQQMLAGQPVGVPFGYENWGSPISEDDIAEQASGPLFDVASVPVTVLNWADGSCKVPWHDGVRSILARRFPDAIGAG